MTERLLDVEDLQVSFATEDGLVRAVDGVSFTLDRGEVVAIVGESGSGKSVTVMTLMGLTRVAQLPLLRARPSWRARELITASEHELERIRGKEIAMIFQDPISSLSPVHRDRRPDRRADPGAREDLQGRRRWTARSALMERVGIPRARDRARAYPHEFSGGMRQRVMIAMALSLSPSVLIADEPTTALDVTIQAQILRGDRRSCADETDSGVIFVTHDLGVVADIADRVIVMYAGRVVEQGTLDEIFYDPQHPYTWGLLGSVTRHGSRAASPAARDSRPAAVAGHAPPRAATSAPAARMRSIAAPRCPPLEARVPEAPEHLDRCWLAVEEKRARREVDGRIGLDDGAVIA